MDKKEVTKKIIDVETGEFIDVYDGDMVRVVRESQIPAINNSIKNKELNEEIKSWNKEIGGFIFVLFKYCNDILNQHPKIAPEDITKLFYLATYVDYKGFLFYKKEYVTKQILIKMLNLCYKSGNEFINKMLGLYIFEMDDTNKYIKLNRNYFVKGNLEKEIKNSNDYTRIYIKTIQYLFENVPLRKHKQLSMYFKLIPFIHRQMNRLCWNPNSRAEDIHLMTLRELKDILGYDRDSIKEFRKELFKTKLENGQSIIGIFQTEYDEGESFIIINPQVFYGGNFKLSSEDEDKNGRYGMMKYFEHNKDK